MADEPVQTNQDTHPDFHKLQARLDEELQAHADTRAAHGATLAAVQAQLDKAIAAAAATKQQCAEAIAQAQAECDAKIAAVQNDCQQQITAVQTATGFRVRQYELQHAEAVAVLSQTPAEREAKAHRAAEIEALHQKHQAELAALQQK